MIMVEGKASVPALLGMPVSKSAHISLFFLCPKISRPENMRKEWLVLLSKFLGQNGLKCEVGVR